MGVAAGICCGTVTQTVPVPYLTPSRLQFATRACACLKAGARYAVLEVLRGGVNLGSEDVERGTSPSGGKHIPTMESGGANWRHAQLA